MRQLKCVCSMEVAEQVDNPAAFLRSCAALEVRRSSLAVAGGCTPHHILFSISPFGLPLFEPCRSYGLDRWVPTAAPNDQLLRRLALTPTYLPTTSPTTSTEVPLAEIKDKIVSPPNPGNRSLIQHRIQPGALAVLLNKPQSGTAPLTPRSTTL